MRKIFTYLLSLFLSLSLYGQGDTITVIRDLDFDMFAIQDSLPKDTALLITGMYDPFTQTTILPYWNIIDLGNGDKVSEMLYPETQCCFPYTDDNYDEGPFLGTSGGGRYYINGATTYSRLALSWNVKLSPNMGDALPTTGGMKMMGLYNPADGSRDSRVAFFELENVDNDSITIKFYPQFYSDDADTEGGLDPNWGSGVPGSAYSTRYDTIPQGVWVNLTLVLYSGTVGSANGYMALYKNRHFMGMRTGLRFHSSADGGQVDFRVVSIEVDAGGSDSETCNMLEDANLLLDDIVVWTWDNIAVTYPYEGQIINLPDECDYPKNESVAEANYYISPSGDDNDPGTYEEPWATFVKAFQTAEAGDTVFCRDGVYHELTSPTTAHSGTEDAYICFFNYPGEKPIIDFGDNAPGDYGNGIHIWNDTFIHVKGIRVQNIWEPSVDAAIAINVWQSAHIIVEQCEVYVIGGAGYSVANSDSVFLINNDAYACIDSSGTKGKADGFRVWDTDSNTTRRNFLRGNRASHCRDDGVDSNTDGYLELTGNWCFNNQVVGGGGAGIKWGLSNVEDDAVTRYIANNISAFNKNGSGFSENNNDRYRTDTRMYNNTSYGNSGYGFLGYNALDDGDVVLTNNVTYHDTTGTYSFVKAITDTYNSWNTPPGVTITNADFISVDSTGISGPRQSDGSLPDINFLKLKSTSDLINAGTDVGLSYNGSAPDLGWYEAPEKSYSASYGGVAVSSRGFSLIIKESNIPTTPASTSEPEFEYTIYKGWVDYSTSTQIGAHCTDTDNQAMWDCPELSYSNFGNPYDYDDSIKIVDEDTIKSTYIGAVNAQWGSNSYGQMCLDGVDGTHDTLTACKRSGFIRFIPALGGGTGWNYSNGGKLPGLGGLGSGAFSSVWPSSGYFAECCDDDSIPQWDQHMGFSARKGWGSRADPFGGDSTVGFYWYGNDLVWACNGQPACTSMTYGEQGIPIQPMYFVPGRWYWTTINLVLNTVTVPGTGDKNGILEFFVDDTCRFSRDTAVFRNYDDITIDMILNAIFVGGSAPDASRTDPQMVQQDDEIIWHDGDRSKHEVGTTINTPQPSTDNRENNPPLVFKNNSIIDDNYMSEKHDENKPEWIIPAEIWGDKWKGDSY